MNLNEMLEQRKKELDRIENHNEAKTNYEDAYQLVEGFKSYKVFIEQIYEKFIKSIIETASRDEIDSDYVQTSINVYDATKDFTLKEFEESAKIARVVNSANDDRLDFVIGAANVVDLGRVQYFIEEEGLSLKVIGGKYFKEYLDDMIVRNGIQRKQYGNFCGSFKTIIDSYYSELQALPLFEEKIRKVAEDFNIEYETLEKIM